MEINKIKSTFWILINVFIGALILNLVFFVMPAVKRFGESLSPVRTISVSAQGKSQVKPDVAQISFSVVSRGKDPKSISEDNNAKINKAIEFVKVKGIDSKDIKTPECNLNHDSEWY